jgi:hypothetical protein
MTRPHRHLSPAHMASLMPVRMSQVQSQLDVRASSPTGSTLAREARLASSEDAGIYRDHGWIPFRTAGTTRTTACGR